MAVGRYMSTKEKVELNRRDDGTYVVVKWMNWRRVELTDYLDEGNPKPSIGDEGDSKTSSGGTKSGIAALQGEPNADTFLVDMLSTTIETIEQPEEHILDSRSAVEGLELAFLLTPASATSHDATPDAPPPSTIDDQQETDEAATPMDLVTLWW